MNPPPTHTHTPTSKLLCPDPDPTIHCISSGSSRVPQIRLQVWLITWNTLDRFWSRPLYVGVRWWVGKFTTPTHTPIQLYWLWHTTTHSSPCLCFSLDYRLYCFPHLPKPICSRVRGYSRLFNPIICWVTACSSVTYTQFYPGNSAGQLWGFYYSKTNLNSQLYLLSL